MISRKWRNSGSDVEASDEEYEPSEMGSLRSDRSARKQRRTSAGEKLRGGRLIKRKPILLHEVSILSIAIECTCSLVLQLAILIG